MFQFHVFVLFGSPGYVDLKGWLFMGSFASAKGQGETPQKCLSIQFNSFFFFPLVNLHSNGIFHINK